MLQIDLFIQGSAQVTIGVDTLYPVILVDYRGHAHALAAHFQQGFRDAGVGRNARYVFTGMHNIRNVQQQSATEAASRVRQRKIFFGETPGIEQCDGEGIAHHKGNGRARGGCEPQRAGFFFHTDIKVNRCFRCQRRIGAPGHADQRHPETLDNRYDGEDFFGVARVGQRQYHIIWRDHSQVAMAGLTGVNEKSRAAGTGERGRDFACYMPGFTHTGNDDSSRAGEHKLAGLGKTVIDSVLQLFHRSQFGFYNRQPQFFEIRWCHRDLSRYRRAH